MIRKIAKPWTEVQLGFAFLSQKEEGEPTAPSCQTQTPPSPQAQKVKPHDLSDSLSQTQTLLLDASLEEVSSQLLPLLEFCEATLTRTLDVIALRDPQLPFSLEEQRSLRGIGQAQWLLTEKLARRSARGEEKLTRRKKTISAEMEKG